MSHKDNTITDNTLPHTITGIKLSPKIPITHSFKNYRRFIIYSYYRQHIALQLYMNKYNTLFLLIKDNTQNHRVTVKKLSHIISQNDRQQVI